MERKTLTLKPRVNPAEETNYISLGRQRNKQPLCPSPALINLLTELVNSRRPIFIQTRHGTGYCGVPVQIQDGWLSMEMASIFGTKQKVTTSSLLIQINDGSFIAHVHPINSAQEGSEK